MQEFPALAAAVAEGGRIPLVLVGDEVKAPTGLSVYWIEQQLAALGVSVHDGDGGGRG